jgi:hypothetical protein
LWNPHCLLFNISPPSGTAIVGDVSYTIQCQITGTTASSWSWTKTPINSGSTQQITQGSKYSIQNSPNFFPCLTFNLKRNRVNENREKGVWERSSWREKKCRSKDPKKGEIYEKTMPPPSFKLNGRSLITILNLWTLQRAEHSTMEHGEECSAVCSVHKF